MVKILICSIAFFIVHFIPLQQGITGVYQIIIDNILALIVIIILMVGFVNEKFINM